MIERSLLVRLFTVWFVRWGPLLGFLTVFSTSIGWLYVFWALFQALNPAVLCKDHGSPLGNQGLGVKELACQILI